MRKLLMLMGALFIIFGGASTSFAEQGSLTVKDMKEIIVKKGLEYNIPPEILKAIAFVESGYTQFDSNGEPFISDDGGIGVMQITPDKIDLKVDKERLKNDPEYNIDIGAQVLNKKWNLSYLPKMNGQERKVLENWYFTIMAYNGLSKSNDPSLHPSSAYPEKVYKRIESASLIYWTTTHFKFPTFDIRYESGDDTMKFPAGQHYSTKETVSQQMYMPGDLIYIDERDGKVTLRNEPDGERVGSSLPYTPLEIIGEPVESGSLGNDYSYYKVKGIEAKGYASSAYLNKADKSFTFPDSYTDERAAALYFLAMNKYVTGYQNGEFGSEDSLKRMHVAVILDRILHLEMPKNYQIKASDVSKGDEYYTELAKAEYNGLLGVGGELHPQLPLTRAQMASVLTRAFAEYYKQPNVEHVFKDQDSIWNHEPINTLYYNHITVADPFRPNEYLTRSQFALFIYRTLN